MTRKNKKAKSYLQYSLAVILIGLIISVVFVMAFGALEFNADNGLIAIFDNASLNMNLSFNGDVSFGVADTNFSEATSYLYNFSLKNYALTVGTNVSQVNITLWANELAVIYYDADTANTSLASGSFTLSNDSNADYTTISWSNDTSPENVLVNWSGGVNTTSMVDFWFNATAAVPGRYNITLRIRDEAGEGNSSTNLTITINDSTNPLMNYHSSGPEEVANLSQDWIWVNMSVTEAKPENITFFLYNSTQELPTVNTTNWSMNFSAYTNTDINWTNLPEGHYFYNATILDASGKSNTTATRSVTLDVAAPNITHSCSPTSVSRTKTITCTCTAVDTWDEAPNVTYTANPDTSATGTFTTTCTSSDDAGNSASNSVSYTVSGGGAASGGGGGGTTYTSTIVEDIKEFSEIGSITKSMKNKQRIRIKINNTKHNIGIAEITATTAKIELFSTLQEATLIVGDVRKFDVTEDRYYDLKISLNSIEANKADITIESIREEITELTQTEEEEREEEAITQAEIEEAANLTWLWIAIGIIVVLIIAGAGYGVKKRKK